MAHVQRFIDTYQRLDRNNLELLGQIYDRGIQFSDPAHQISGLDDLTRYFILLYANVSTIEFSFERQLGAADETVLEWVMTFAHPRLAGNRPISVPGCSWLRFNPDGLAIAQRDYFDLGAMLYEQLPGLGRIVRIIKGRLGQ